MSQYISVIFGILVHCFYFLRYLQFCFIQYSTDIKIKYMKSLEDFEKTRYAKSAKKDLPSDNTIDKYNQECPKCNGLFKDVKRHISRCRV